MIIGVGTGRCGTVTVADLLELPHEPNPKMIRESVEFAYGKKQPAIDLLQENLCNPGLVNHRYSLLIQPLVVNHQARILHIIRDGRPTVASFMARKFYHSKPGDKIQEKNGFEKWHLDPTQMGYVHPSIWSEMTPFEKCCWHWNFVNIYIMGEIRRTYANSFTIRIEDVWNDVKRHNMMCWAHGKDWALKRVNYAVPWKNGSSEAAFKRLENWTPVMHETFWAYCGLAMAIFYPEVDKERGWMI